MVKAMTLLLTPFLRICHDGEGWPYFDTLPGAVNQERRPDVTASRRLRERFDEADAHPARTRA
jgi:hypothetical protein